MPTVRRWASRRVDGRQSFHGATGELRFSGRAMNRFDWVVGGFYYDGNMSSGQQVSIPAFVPARSWSTASTRPKSKDESA